jgi:SAM-dependent methyltransferase
VQLTERCHDVVTGANDLEPLHCLPDFPVFMGSVLHPAVQDLRADMAWSIAKSSGLIQLTHLLPLEVLYQHQTTTAAIGAIWMAHHRAFAAFLSTYRPGAVLELGGAHGILAREFLQFDAVPWTILEPNPAPVAGCPARFIQGFFDASFRTDSAFDTVVHSHVLEHIYEPDIFMGQLAQFMKPGQHLVFSVPDLQVWLERKYTNCINFEHTTFLTAPYVEHLLSKHGFLVVAKDLYGDGHSIFYAAVRDPQAQVLPLPSGLYERNREIYENFVQYHTELIADLNHRMDDADGPVYLFGAHVFAQYLLAFGLRTDKIVALLDNDVNKQGKRLYGTELQVLSPKVLRDVPEATVILKAGMYTLEIREDILRNINADVRFLE